MNWTFCVDMGKIYYHLLRVSGKATYVGFSFRIILHMTSSFWEEILKGGEMVFALACNSLIRSWDFYLKLLMLT